MVDGWWTDGSRSYAGTDVDGWIALKGVVKRNTVIITGYNPV